MKKYLLIYLLAICFLLPCFSILSACKDKVTDCAYIQFVPAIDGEVVQYTSEMYGTHIYLFDNEETRDSGSWDDNYLLKLTFNRNLGVDTIIDEEGSLCVSIEGWSSMEISITKEYYDSSKKVYLNENDITSKADQTLSRAPQEKFTQLGSFWLDGIYYFEDFGLVKGNSSNYINTIEYK